MLIITLQNLLTSEAATSTTPAKTCMPDFIVLQSKGRRVNYNLFARVRVSELCKEKLSQFITT